MRGVRPRGGTRDRAERHTTGMTARHEGKCGSKCSRKAGKKHRSSRTQCGQPCRTCFAASPQSPCVSRTCGQENNPANGKHRPVGDRDSIAAVDKARTSRPSYHHHMPCSTEPRNEPVASHCARPSPNPTPSLAEQACIARMLSRRMRFTTKSPLSSTSSNQSTRTLVFGAVKDSVLYAALEPIPAAWSRRQHLTPYSSLRFGDALCGPG